MTKSRMWKEVERAAREVPRDFFAPLVGAVRGIRSEYRHLDALRRKQAAQERAQPAKQEKSGTVHG